MQTVLVIQSSVAGAVYLGGRLAGEVDDRHPLTLPVSPFGALILELRPFTAGYLPLALRIPLSHGVPLISAPDSRFCAALWPGDVVELELIPEPLPLSAPPRFLCQIGDVRFSCLQARTPSLRCESSAAVFTHSLPDGALPPSVSPLPAGFLLTGGLPEGDQYALVLSPDASSVLLSVSGRNLSLLDGGAALRILRPSGDTVGHAALETWAASPAGWQLTASEPMWLTGGPAWPQTPEAAAIAAVEAAQLGLANEAAAYFSPLCPCADVLARAAAFDGCVPLRYPLPDGESAIGLMRLRDHLLRIVPARYSAAPGGTHGPWQLTKLEIPPDAAGD